MRVTTVFAWLLGVAIVAALVWLNGPARIFEAIAALRWWLAAIAAWHLIPLMIDARAWQLLFASRPPLPPLLRAIWIGEGLNGLFPLPHVGELMRARLGARIAGAREGVSSVIVDLTLSVATEGVFALVGLALLSTLPGAGNALRIVAPAAAAIAAAALAFYFLQRAGLFALAGRIAHRWSATARKLFEIGSAEALDAGVRQVYWRRGALIEAAAWRFAGWIAGAGETWLIFYAAGHPIGIAEAIVVESLGHAARTAAFAIPAGLGVQDGALMLLGAALGFGPEMGLVVALAKRCRELILGLPALAIGYLLEARNLMQEAA